MVSSVAKVGFVTRDPGSEAFQVHGGYNDRRGRLCGVRRRPPPPSTDPSGSGFDDKFGAHTPEPRALTIGLGGALPSGIEPGPLLRAVGDRNGSRIASLAVLR